MTRQEHLQWAKNRAMEYVANGDLQQAFTSMGSDLQKHPELDGAAKIHGELGMMQMINGLLNTPEAMTKWIQGFN